MMCVSADVGPHAVPSRDQPLFPQHRQRAFHGPYGDAVGVGESLMAWKLLPWPVVARLHCGTQAVRKLLIRRAGVVWVEFVHDGQGTTA